MAAKKSFRYIRSFSTGIYRLNTGREFEYCDHEGSQIADPSVLSRIHSLSIPPNWTDVWICPTQMGTSRPRDSIIDRESNIFTTLIGPPFGTRTNSASYTFTVRDWQP